MFSTNLYKLSSNVLLCIHIQWPNAHMRFFLPCNNMLLLTVTFTGADKEYSQVQNKMLRFFFHNAEKKNDAKVTYLIYSHHFAIHFNKIYEILIFLNLNECKVSSKLK